IVQQGENLYLYQIMVQVQNVKDADALLHHLKVERGTEARYDLLLRRLDPLVLVNRKELDQVADTITGILIKYRLAELHFAIARKSVDLHEMLRWATTTLQLAEQEVQEAPSLAARDRVAEAHFNLGVYYLQLGEHDKMFKHFVAQLRVKID